MLQIGSKYKNPEVSIVLFGKTAVRDNIMLKLSLCKSIIVEITRVPIVTDSGRNILAAVSDMESHRCMAHRLHTVLNDAWGNAKAHNIEIQNLDLFSRNLVTFVKASNSIQGV